MATPRSAGLDRLLARHRERQMRQMGIAITGLVVVLGALALSLPRATPDAPALVAEAPEQAAPGPNAFASVALTGKAAIVYDLSTGETLFERNARAQLPLASLTKLLTLYAAADTLPRDARITIDERALSADGDSGFIAGETFRFVDLAHAALVGSSNDATEAIAEATEAKRNQSGEIMLASAASAAGLSQTYALNGTGLDESLSVSGGYGSAADVAKLAGALLEKAPAIARASTDTSVTITSNSGIPHTFANTNPNVVRVPNILLSKTGFTDLAGGNLVVVFDAGISHPVAIVVLGSTREGRFADVNELLDRTLAHFAGVPAR